MSKKGEHHAFTPKKKRSHGHICPECGGEGVRPGMNGYRRCACGWQADTKKAAKA